MMIVKDINKIIQQGETETRELKSSFNNEVLETIVAFANKKGVVGVPIGRERVQHWVNDITIFNPGTLFGGLTIEDLKTDNYLAQARNKLIAEAFYLTKDIEKYGSGCRRVREQIADYRTMELDFLETSGGYLVKVSYREQKTSTRIIHNDTDNDTGNDTDRKKALLKLISKDNKLTVAQMAEALHVSRITILRDIDKLKKQNKLNRIGPEKGGYWQIINK